MEDSFKELRNSHDISMVEAAILERIMAHMGWQLHQALLWMEKPNPILGGLTPKYLCTHGKGARVIAFIKSAEDFAGH